jgi:HsdM N-terminal domain
LLTEKHNAIASKIWEIANRLRGPYRPPQYRLIMLPMVVLRRLDCVLEPTKEAVLAEHKRLVAANTPENAIPRLLTRVVDKNRKQPLYNVSAYTFQKLLGDSENIAPNLVAYINDFSEAVRRIFEKFKFGEQIEKLDASNRLFNIVKPRCRVLVHIRWRVALWVKPFRASKSCCRCPLTLSRPPWRANFPSFVPGRLCGSPSRGYACVSAGWPAQVADRARPFRDGSLALVNLRGGSVEPPFSRGGTSDHAGNAYPRG